MRRVADRADRPRAGGAARLRNGGRAAPPEGEVGRRRGIAPKLELP